MLSRCMPSPVLPRPPYYVAIFRSTRNTHDDPGYQRTSERMFELARLQPGFLGVHSVRDEDGNGITLSYWTDEASIRAWRAQDEHGVVRESGRRSWYERYTVQIARVERGYGWDAASEHAAAALMTA